MLAGYQKLATRIHLDFIIITGDYRNYNKDDDYSKALGFLTKIVDVFGVKKQDVFLVPGNHDVEPYKFREEAIAKILKGIKEDPDVYLRDLEVSPHLYDAFGKYKEFIQSFYKNDVTDCRTDTPERIMCLQ